MAIVPENRVKRLVKKCPRCGAMAPLLASGLLANYPDGVCARCLSDQLSQLVASLRELGHQVGRFLIDRGVVEPNTVLPKGQALYDALVKATLPVE
jgi:ribosomal protein S27AE